MICKKCKSDKGVNDFYGKMKTCKDCHKAYAKQHRKYKKKGKWIHTLTNINPETKTATCKNCGEVRIRKTRGVWRCKPAEAKWKDGIGYGYRFGTCELCNNNAVLVKDHRHEDGMLRGWICLSCNVVIGKIETGKYEKYYDYIEKYNAAI